MQSTDGKIFKDRPFHAVQHPPLNEPRDRCNRQHGAQLPRLPGCGFCDSEGVCDVGPPRVPAGSGLDFRWPSDRDHREAADCGRQLAAQRPRRRGRHRRSAPVSIVHHEVVLPAAELRFVDGFLIVGTWQAGHWPSPRRYHELVATRAGRRVDLQARRGQGGASWGDGSQVEGGKSVPGVEPADAPGLEIRLPVAARSAAAAGPLAGSGRAGWLPGRVLA